MQIFKKFFPFAILLWNLLSYNTLAQNPDSTIAVKNLILNTHISGQYYMSYNYNDQTELQQFSLKRGYFTIHTKLNNVFSIRYTQDITLDKEGSDAGNIELKIKYLYLQTKLDEIEFLKTCYIQVGMVPRPWITFDQNINDYRVQGTMFLERNLFLSSADFGISFSGLFGGEIDSRYKKEINNKDAGKYGSFSLGIYNGAGYDQTEKNNNKVFESRITFRPFPIKIPGLQISHGLSFGQPNLSDSIPHFMMNVLMLSTESKYHKFTAQYYTGKGDSKGIFMDENNESLKNEGYSFFGELLIPKSRFAMFARYDKFSIYNPIKNDREIIIAGMAYRFLKNKILFDFQNETYEGKKINLYEIALEFAF